MGMIGLCNMLCAKYGIYRMGMVPSIILASMRHGVVPLCSVYLLV